MKRLDDLKKAYARYKNRQLKIYCQLIDKVIKDVYKEDIKSRYSKKLKLYKNLKKKARSQLKHALN